MEIKYDETKTAIMAKQSSPTVPTQSIEEFLDALPEDIEFINIGRINLTYIPDSIIRFTKLIKLYCDCNSLTKLPDNLPKSLVLLNCSHNKITAFPDNLFANMTGLRLLNCSYNEITKLPDNISTSLPNLEFLYCHGNQINIYPMLPESITWFAPNIYDENDNILERYPLLEELNRESEGGHRFYSTKLILYINSQNTIEINPYL